MASLIPLSFAQLQIWLLDRMSPGTLAYNMPVGYRLSGPIDYAALEKSLNGVIRRHASLRTTFAVIEGEPRQIIHPPYRVAIRTMHLDNHPAGTREQPLQDLISQELQTHFDLERLPLIRVTLFKLEECDHLLLINLHHILADGTSLSVMLEDLDSFYSFFTGSSSTYPADLEVQYSDIAALEREQSSSCSYDREIGFWRQELEGAPFALDLPADFQRPPVQSLNGANVFFEIPNSLVNQLESLGKRYGCTAFAVFLAAYQVLLFRYSNQEDFVVGTPLAQRATSPARRLIGNFINMIPLRFNLSGDPTFSHILQQTNRRTLRAFSRSALPFVKLIENVPFNRDPSRSPIFQTMIELLPEVPSAIGQLKLERYYFDLNFAQFDISFHAWKESYGYACRFEYCTDLFREDTIQRMSANFLQLLSSVAENPDQHIGSIATISESERAQLFLDWNATSHSYPNDRCVHHLIASVAEVHPTRTAVECDGAALTYSQLNHRANQLANRLLENGVKQGDRVGVYLERSTWLPVALLGILKAGAAYVPLDPSFPADRLRYMISDAELRVVVAQLPLHDSLPVGQPNLITVDVDASSGSSADASDPLLPFQPSDLAYTIYTSGSSGKPKGVMIEHRSLVNCLSSMRKEPGFTSSDILVAVTTISFDIAALEIFLPLVCGGTLVLASRNQAVDPHLLAGLLDRCHATILQATPATWKLLLETTWQPTPEFKMLCGGEPLSRELADCLLTRGGRLFNMYGPTETTIWSSVDTVHQAAGSVPLGPPLANTQFYVVDHRLHPVPIGVPGELLIGGDGLARGYLNQPELTRQRFVTLQLGGHERRAYRTGDIVKWRPDGRLEFLGRRDFQVKLRGFRIELEEIEHALMSHPAVKDAAVVAWREADSDIRLVAHYIPLTGHTPPISELRDHIRTSLPEYMCPSFFVEHSSFPLTPNGKVDRKALPPPNLSTARSSDVPEEPKSDLEARLLQIWQETLKVPVKVDDNFFDLGGHSLLAARMFLRIEEQVGVRIPLAALFRYPTVRDLAGSIEEISAPTCWRPLVPIQPAGTRPPLFLVHGAEGNVMLYRNLARHLGPQQPVYGLQSLGLDGTDVPGLTIQKLAAAYCEEIRSVQPVGPYYVGGYCLGGTIALEIALQLKKANEPVALVALLETYNIKSRPPISPSLRLFHGLQNLLFQAGNVIRSNGDPHFFFEKLRTELGRISLHIDVARRGITRAVDRSAQLSYLHLKVKQQNHHAQEAYNPGEYDGAVALFRSVTSYRGLDDPHYGWRDVALRGVRVFEMSNYPHGSLNEPFVQTLAQTLRAELDRAGRETVHLSQTAAEVSSTCPSEVANSDYSRTKQFSSAPLW